MLTKFRAFRPRATWGIAVNISGHLLEGNIPEGYYVLSEPTGILRIAVLEKLNEIEIKWFERGMRYFLDTHPDAISKPLLIRIDVLEFNYCDFQDEGMAPAINLFLCELLSLTPAEILITYDKASNRYTVHLD